MEDIPLHSPYIGLIYARYLHFRILKFVRPTTEQWLPAKPPLVDD